MMISLRGLKRMPLFLVSLLLAAQAQAAQPEAQPVPSVNLDRYAGRWYEYARTPNLFESFCSCVTATYGKLSDTSVSVFNACNRFSAKGPLTTINGVATALDPSQPGKLQVTFSDGPPFPAAYWIVGLVDDATNPTGPYEFAAVSGPLNGFLYVLSRKPQLTTPQDQDAYNQFLASLQSKYLPVKRLNNTPQPQSCNYDAQQP